VATRARIGIVGAGIVGSVSAFELARRGCSVTVFDRRALGAGATQASAGILAPFVEGHEHRALLSIAVRGLSAYDDFVRRVRQTTTVPFEYQRSGTLEIADTPERANVLKGRIHAVSADVGFEWITAAQLRVLEPAVSPDHAGALFCRAHGFVAVMPLVSAVVDAAKRHGASFHESTEVRDIQCGRSCIVCTQSGNHEFDGILLCTGSWASALDPFSELGGVIRPIKGQLVVLRWDGLPITRVLWGNSCYIVRWNDGTLLVGATAEDVGFDERPIVGGINELLSAASELLPAVRDATFVGVRVGLRPATDDGLPVIGPSRRDPRVFYATGHFRNGVLLAPLTAELVAGYFLTGQSDPAFRLPKGA
jgi:glycine oxidase